MTDVAQHWERVNRRDRRAICLADRHYSRQVVGAPQVGGNGRLIVLVTPSGSAAWITIYQHVKRAHGWDAWVCAMFRNESPVLSSVLITEAVAVTRYLWGNPPVDGFITFVDTDKVRHKRDPGRCYRKAGWRRIRDTKGGLVTLQLLPNEIPSPVIPLGALPLEAA